jgi:hypothetical protein
MQATRHFSDGDSRRKARIDGAAEDIATMPVPDPRSPREIMDVLNVQ